jgi:hypothetical protein
MEPIGISLHIIRVDKDNIDCRISNDTEDNTLNFFVADGAITFAKENHLALITRNNQHQLRRIIRSAIKGNIHVGQTINCVFIEGFKFLKLAFSECRHISDQCKFYFCVILRSCCF